MSEPAGQRSPSPKRDRLRSLYEVGAFRPSADALTDCLSQYLTEAITSPAAATPPAAELIARARDLLDAGPGPSTEALTPAAIGERFRQLANEFLRGSRRLHSPACVGHQVPPPIPTAGLFDGLSAVANQAMGVYEMGPFATAVERAVIGKLGEYLGWPAGRWDAIGTHGGSLANLTALLTARNVRYPGIWETGLARRDGRVPAIVTSADSHYSVARSAGILGLGTQQVLEAPLDRRRRLCPDLLPAVLERAEREGFDVFALVATAGSTAVGAFDRLDELADIARQRGLWLHVDGAHGASALLSRTHRHLLRGVEGVSSLTWDAHKMLFAPALCTFLFTRDRSHTFETFRQNAPYLFNPDDPGQAAHDSAVRTVECTKRAMALGLWGTWSIHGPSLFEDLIDVTFDLTRQFHDLLLATDDFVPLHEPEGNILCFRHLPATLRGASEQEVSDFQQLQRRRVIEAGAHYITSTKLDGVAALRVTLMNPLTELSHLESLLHSLRQLAE